jgi:DNA repair protein RecO (recombination protein O)
MYRTRLFNTQAIILRRTDQGEADRLLTILTPERGKLKVLAKGVRKLTGKKTGHVELFTRVHMILAQGRTFDIVSQVETIDPHMCLREDVKRAGLAHYVCEVVESFAQEETDESELYDLLANALGWLCVSPDPVLAVRYVEMRLLTLMGYRPQLFRCAKTGEPLDIDHPEKSLSENNAPSNDAKSAQRVITTYFSPSSGGVLSGAAMKMARDAIPLMPQSVQLLRAFVTQTYETLQTLVIPSDVHYQIERALRLNLLFVLERNLRSTQFLKHIQ